MIPKATEIPTGMGTPMKVSRGRRRSPTMIRMRTLIRMGALTRPTPTMTGTVSQMRMILIPLLRPIRARSRRTTRTPIQIVTVTPTAPIPTMITMVCRTRAIPILSRRRPKVTLMASGIGISPMRALLEGLPQQPGEVTLLYRARSEADLALKDEIETIAARTGAKVYYLLGRRIPGRDTWLPEAAAGLTDAQALRQLVPDIDQHDVYLCGATAWMNAATTAALECGVPADHIHTERFSW